MTQLDPSIVAKAAQRLEGIVNRTPVMTSRTLNGRTGCQVYLKCENFQRVGAFKFRGAYNAISQLSQVQKAAGVITHSSGNHAQGVALAAKLLDVTAVIVMPEDAPKIKRDATAGYGAHIVPCAAIDRERVTAELIEKQGYTLIHPYDNDDIIAGQGTAAWELFQEVGPLDTLFVPVGGGGLISGCALAAAARSPHCRVVGVEPEIAADANRSWRDNQVHTLDQVPNTIADGLRTRFVGRRNLAVMREYVADMTTISEEAIVETLAFLWTRLKVVVEPSAAVALAPLFTGQYQKHGRRVGVILSGGNVDIARIQALFREQASETATVVAPPPPPPPGNDQAQARILVCDAIDEAGLEILQETADVDVKPNLSEEALLALIGSYDAIVVDQDTRLTGQMIEYGYNLRAIGAVGSTLDNIDVSAARAMGIEVCNAPGSNAVAIAEHTLSRLLTLSERFADGRLAGKTLGIIGFGRVGRQVAKRAGAFDMRVVINQPRLTPELALSGGVEATDLVDLLQQADFVTLHVPFKAETETIVGAEELELMKPTACLINSGHTDLVDEAALLDALQNGRIAAAALSTLPPEAKEDGKAPAVATALRQHEKAVVEPHVTTILGNRRREAAVAVARQIATILRSGEVQESLSLELAPIEQVMPHEEVDDKRVARLMERLQADSRLINPPITTYWNGRYIILDGATRFTALKRLGFPHIIVQVVQPDQEGFALHTWYHAISSQAGTFAQLVEHLQSIDDVQFMSLPADEIQTAFEERAALCYFLDREGNATLAQVEDGADRLATMNAIVASYTEWGRVERTLLTDLPRLLAQFPQMVAVAVFPQFQPETVFNVARRGDFLPAGLTRFVIPGRILRLNADLDRLKKDEPLADKRAWFERFLEQKLAHSRLRYYQEPVILLDE